MDETNKTVRNTVSAIGVMLGLLSSAAVHQSISWVKNFPTGVNVPAFGDGTLYRDVDRALVEQLDSGRYLFFVTHVGRYKGGQNDEVKSATVLYNNCFLGGDPEIREDALLFMAASTQLGNMFNSCLGSLKNL